MAWEFCPEKIRARLNSARYWKVDVSVAESLDDVEMLVAEVERLQAKYIALRDQYTTLQYVTDDLAKERDKAQREVQWLRNHYEQE
jgi:predicted nuclease with TOPRIM domain